MNSRFRFTSRFANGTNVLIVFFRSAPSACLPFCFGPGGKGGTANKMKGLRYTVKIVVFVEGPLLETVVPLGKLEYRLLKKNGSREIGAIFVLRCAGEGCCGDGGGRGMLRIGT